MKEAINDIGMVIHIITVERQRPKKKNTTNAAGLGDEQGRVVEVVLAAVQRIKELADEQKRRVAGIVVDLFQV